MAVETHRGSGDNLWERARRSQLAVLADGRAACALNPRSHSIASHALRSRHTHDTATPIPPPLAFPPHLPPR